MSVFADAAPAYFQAEWPCVMPVPPEKSPPPLGFTGADGIDSTPEQLVQWMQSHPDHSIALRLPDGVIGIDVDHYDKGNVQKRGADTLARYVEQWGELPPTWICTARGSEAGPGPSGIRFYRVPAGRYVTKLGPDIEIIQRHHRYAVVWPSPHLAAGDIYMWYSPPLDRDNWEGVGDRPDLLRGVPAPDELPWLPERWVAGLREGATEAAPASASHDAGYTLLAALQADERPACADIANVWTDLRPRLIAADEGGRHDSASPAVYQMIQLAAHGHVGVGPVLAELKELWDELTSGEDREAEFERMLISAARKAVTVVGTAPVPVDPCFMAGAIPVTSPAPGDDRPDAEAGEAVQPDVVWSPRMVIGTHAFDPETFFDQTLAQDVLERTYPLMRYAYDSGAWLLRGPHRWDERGDLTGWAIAELAGLMPHGSLEAEKDSDEYVRAKRRARFLTSGASGGISKKMVALVAAGTHPCALRLADLDAEATVLWAGGLPWDLAGSAEAPALAQIDPHTPHLHAAAIAPDARETPLWDAFVAAVWPDPEVRAYALRVLSISLTGYADAALPVLLGETRRGKTALMSLIMSVLGTYAHSADPRLLGSADNAHASIVIALKGRRLSFIDEGPRDGRFAQERLKQLTGGAQLTGNAMRKDPVTFTPTHTLVLTANDEPSLTDPAVRARVRLIPCEGDPEQVRQTRAAIGNTNGAAWRREAPGVLAALMGETAAWLADRSSALTSAAPAGIRFLAEEMAVEQDPIKSWVDEETEIYEAGTRSRTLFEAFVQWARNGNVHAARIPTETKWGRALNDLGFAGFHTREGNRRPLRLRIGGDWAQYQMPQISVTGSPDGVTSSDGSPEQPLTEHNRRSDPVFPIVVKGVNSSTPLIEHNKENTHIEGYGTTAAGVPGEPGATLQPLPEVAENCVSAGQTPVDLENGPITADPEPSQADNPAFSAQITAGLLAGKGEPAAEPVKPKRTRKTPEEREAEKAAKAQAKIAEQRAKLSEAIAAAAGRNVPLPAVVINDGHVYGAVGLEQVRTAVELAVKRSGELSIDVETSGYPIGFDDYALRTIQLGDDLTAVVLDADNPEHQELAREQIAKAPKLHAHSATADLAPLAYLGLLDYAEAHERMVDTAILAKLADPESTDNSDGLKDLAAAVLGDAATSPAAEKAKDALFKAGKWLKQTKVTTPVARSGWAQVDSDCETMVRYAASDVLDAAAIAKRLPAPDPAVLKREQIAAGMTARVGLEGVQLDLEQIRRLKAEHTPLRDAAAVEVRKFGIDNPGSDVQIARKLASMGAPLPRTDNGAPSVAKGAIEPLAHDQGDIGELVRQVLEFRTHDQRIGTFLEPWELLCTRGDGRARPTVYTLGADTGRMSCVRPNLQQVPREGGFRSCITADPGELAISADFASVEIRVMAALSQDVNLMQQLAAGLDTHKLIAEQVFGPEWTKSDRYITKRGVFGWAYGGGIPTLAKQLGVSESIVASVVDVLAQLAPQYVQWAEALKGAVKSGATQMPTYAGRAIHLPQRFPHKAPNYAIQGTARELLVDALIKWRETQWGGYRVLPVHDEIVAFVPEAEAEAATAELVRCMETALYGVAITAEASAPSFAWSDSV